MEFKAKGSELLEGFQLAASVVGPKATREVTKNTKLVARKSGHGGKPEIALYAVGEETSLIYRFEPDELITPGQLVLPGETMVGVLREVRNQPVHIKSTDLSCEVKLEGCFFRVLGEDPSGFPEEMKLNESGAISMPAALLQGMLSRILFAASTEDTRYAMNGVLFSLEAGTLDLVATDGRRLAYVQGKVPEARKGDSVIVPRVSVTQALKLLGSNAADQVRISFDEHQFALETDAGLLFSRLIDGKFPPHKEVIPKNTTFSVQFPTDRLQAAVRQASLLTDPASRSVRFQFDDGQLEISARTADKGEARITVPVEFKRDQSFTIYFNPDYIADCLKSLDCDEVTVSFTDTSHQAVISDGAGFLYVLMPVTPSAG